MTKYQGQWQRTRRYDKGPEVMTKDQERWQRTESDDKRPRAMTKDQKEKGLEAMNKVQEQWQGSGAMVTYDEGWGHVMSPWAWKPRRTSSARGPWCLRHWLCPRYSLRTGRVEVGNGKKKVESRSQPPLTLCPWCLLPSKLPPDWRTFFSTVTMQVPTYLESVFVFVLERIFVFMLESVFVFVLERIFVFVLESVYVFGLESVYVFVIPPLTESCSSCRWWPGQPKRTHRWTSPLDALPGVRGWRGEEGAGHPPSCLRTGC